MRSRSHNGGPRVDPDSLRLDPGSHASPRDGVCLLELASMIAEEPFSDRPRCVCVVISAFLRSWNDRSSHAQRQRLRPYARRVVGSRARRSVTRRRRDICLTWAGADLTGNWVSRALRRFGMRLRILALCGLRPALRLNEGAGELASRVVFSRYGSEAGLRLVGTLLDVGSELGRPGSRAGTGQDALAQAVVEAAIRDPVPLPHGPGSGNGNGNGHGHANGNGNGNGRVPEPVSADR
jgi:hypothetical protein